jgi:hypothetical protein
MIGEWPEEDWPGLGAGGREDMRFRIRTIMIAVTMIGLATALAVQGWRADRRETALRARLLAAEKEKDVALSALARLRRLSERKILRLPYHD